MLLCATFVGMNLSSFNINFMSLFCITCNLFTLLIEALPYISMPYLILKNKSIIQLSCYFGGNFIFDVIEYSKVIYKVPQLGRSNVVFHLVLDQGT